MEPHAASTAAREEDLQDRVSVCRSDKDIDDLSNVYSVSPESTSGLKPVKQGKDIGE